MNERENNVSRLQNDVSELVLAEIYSLKNNLDLPPRKNSELLFNPNPQIPDHARSLMIEPESNNSSLLKSQSKWIGVRLSTHSNGVYKLPDLLAIQADAYGVDTRSVLEKRSADYAIPKDNYDTDNSSYSITATIPQKCEAELIILLIKWLAQYNLGELARNRYSIISLERDKKVFKRFKAIDKVSKKIVFLDIYNFEPIFSEKSRISIFKLYNLTILPQEHLLTLYKLIKYDDKLGVIWEYAPHSFDDLIEKLSGKKIPENILFFIVKSLVKAILAFHVSNIIISDFSSKNIYFTKSGQIKISLFTGLIPLTLTDTDLFVDHDQLPFILPPEALSGKNKSISIDYYSLALIIYELVNRKVPYSDLLPFERLLTSQCAALPDLNAEYLSEECNNFYTQISKHDHSERSSDTIIMANEWLNNSTIDCYEARRDLMNLLNN